MIDNAHESGISAPEADEASHDASAVAPSTLSESPSEVAHAEGGHPQAGMAVEGWSDPKDDQATPRNEFGKLVLKRSGALTDIEFAVNPPTIIGRFDPTVGPIDVDLGPLPEGSYVSRRHAKIGYENGAWTVKDLGSSNGTYVLREDFEKVDEAEIHDGQEIALGNARFVFYITAKETSIAQ